MKVCPFWNQNENETTLARREFGALKDMKYDLVTGFYLDLFSGYSKVDNHRERGASGGFATWFLEKVLSEGIAKKICCVIPNNGPGALFKYALADSVADLRKASRSVYYPVELSRALPQMFAMDDKYVVIGLPCALKALRLAMLNNAVLRKRIILLAGLVCGQQKSRFFAEYLCSMKKGNPCGLLSASFRLKDAGRHHLDHRFEFSYKSGDRVINDTIYQTEGMSRAWGLDYFKINACNFCDDITSETADVAFGDAIAEPYCYGNKGANFVIARAGLARDLLLKGVSSGEIVLDKAPLNAVVERQKGAIQLKRRDLRHRLYIKRNNKDSYVPVKRFSPRLRLDIFSNQDMETRDKISIASREAYAKYRHQPDAALEVEKAVNLVLKKRGPVARLINRCAGALR